MARRIMKAKLYIMTKNRTLFTRCVYVLLLAVLLGLPGRTYAQESKVSLVLKDAPLKECIDAIERQTRYLFVYNDGCNLQTKVSVSISNETLKRALDIVFADPDIYYRVEGGSVILTRRNKEAATARGPVTVKGVVADADGVPVIGAAVMLKGTSIGAITDSIPLRFRLHFQLQYFRWIVLASSLLKSL